MDLIKAMMHKAGLSLPKKSPKLPLSKPTKIMVKNLRGDVVFEFTGRT